VATIYLGEQRSTPEEKEYTPEIPAAGADIPRLETKKKINAPQRSPPQVRISRALKQSLSAPKPMPDSVGTHLGTRLDLVNISI